MTRWERLLPHYSRSDGRPHRRRRRPRVRLHRAPAVRARARARHPRDLAQPDLARPRDPPAAVRPRGRRHEGDGRDLDDRAAPGRDGRDGTRVEISHEFRPRVPGFAAFVDAAFTRPIAGPHARHLPGPRRGARGVRSAPAGEHLTWPRARPRPAPRRHHRHRRHLRGRDRACRRSARACARRRARSSASTASTRRRSGRRSRRRSTTSSRSTTWTPGRRARSTGSASSGSRRGGWRWPMPGLVPGAAGAPARERIGIYLGSALGGIAFAETQHEQYLERGLRSVSPTLALAVFGGAAPANLGIALDVRGPILSTANSCASRRGRDRRGAQGDPRRRDRRGDRGRRRGPAVAARVRRVRPDPGPRPRLQRRPGARRAADGRPPRRLRHGRGRGAARARGGGRRASRGARVPYAEVLGLRATSDAHHMVQPRADGREAARAVTLALADAGVAPDEIDWVSAHASSTPIGDIAEARALAAGARATARRPCPCQRDEGADRPPARRHGRASRPRWRASPIARRLRPGPVNLEAPSPSSTRSCRACCARAATPASTGSCRRRSGSAG